LIGRTCFVAEMLTVFQSRKQLTSNKFSPIVETSASDKRVRRLVLYLLESACPRSLFHTRLSQSTLKAAIVAMSADRAHEQNNHGSSLHPISLTETLCSILAHCPPLFRT